MSYIRPAVTKTDKLTKEEIAEKLKNYKRVDKINDVPLNTHLRYYTKNKEGRLVFRLGGFLLRNNGLPTYVILTNNKTKPWSVQTKDTIFFRKISQTEIDKQNEELILALRTQNKELKHKIKRYIELIQKLEKKSKRIS